MTFGIVPESPNTGYGYIEVGDEDADAKGVHSVARFVEKPSLDVARTYLKEGRFLWNSGMFLFRASVILDELARHAPQVASAVAEASRGFKRDGLFVRWQGTFASLVGVSIDVAVMEKTAKAFVLPVDIGWSDVGSWSSLWKSRRRTSTEMSSGTGCRARQHGMPSSLRAGTADCRDRSQAIGRGRHRRCHSRYRP